MVVRPRFEGHLACHLCGAGGTDSRTHVYGGSCQPVEVARASFFGGLDLHVDGGLEDALLVSPFLSKRHSVALTSFNVAIWQVIKHYAASRSRVDCLKSMSGRIAEAASLIFGSSSGGTSGDDQATVALANNPPEEALVAFTDGSRLDSGQSGAGLPICAPPGFPAFQISVPLGQNSNNVAELFALGLAFTELLAALRSGNRLHGRHPCAYLLRFQVRH
jgi:hypothetical protein